VGLLSLLGNGSVNRIPRQLRIIGGVVFYAICVVTKESKLLVLPRISCKLIIANNSATGLYTLSSIRGR
jgi:hypothetical protein